MKDRLVLGVLGERVKFTRQRGNGFGQPIFLVMMFAHSGASIPLLCLRRNGVFTYQSAAMRKQFTLSLGDAFAGELHVVRLALAADETQALE